MTQKGPVTLERSTVTLERSERGRSRLQSDRLFGPIPCFMV